MMNGLLHVHSSLRYFIFLFGIVHVTSALMGILSKSAPKRVDFILDSVFSGLIHLQVLLGLVMLWFGRFYPQLIGHLLVMLLAATFVQVLLSMNKKRLHPMHRMRLIAVGGALALIVIGILAIGRSPLAMTVTCKAASTF